MDYKMMNKDGPNPNTVADGYSLTDERQPIGGVDLDFTYGDGDDADDGQLVETGMDAHLPHSDNPMLQQSHVGEHRGDYGQISVGITKSAYLFSFCAAVNSCNLGYDIGVNTTAGPLVQDDMKLSDTQIEMLFGCLNLFAIFGALGAQYVSDTYGRRRSFIVAAIGFIIGVGIMAFAGTYATLMVGRVFIGLGVGFGLAIDPVYISEIVPASHRGELVTWSEIATNIGIVLGFASGWLTGSLPDNEAWRYMFGLGAVLPVVMIILVLTVMPESPRWLVSQGQTQEARAVLTRVYPAGYDIEPLLLDIKEAMEREATAERSVGWDVLLFPTPAFKRMLLVGIGTAVAQQAVGIDAIQYFLVYIIKETGIESQSSQTGVLVLLGLIKLFFIIIGGKLFDRKGRRPLFFVSLCGMAFALLMLSINFFGPNHSANFGIFALAVYLSFFSLGMGPGAWLIPSEVFATCIRAKAMSVATCLNRATSTIMSSTFLSTAHAMSWSAFFFLLAVVCILVCIFLHHYLPETNGRSLEDMSVYFAEITGDNSILEAEANIKKDREARELAATTSVTRSFRPPKTSNLPPDMLQDASVVGTMA